MADALSYAPQRAAVASTNVKPTFKLEYQAQIGMHHPMDLHCA